MCNPSELSGEALIGNGQGCPQLLPALCRVSCTALHLHSLHHGPCPGYTGLVLQCSQPRCGGKIWWCSALPAPESLGWGLAVHPSCQNSPLGQLQPSGASILCHGQGQCPLGPGLKGCRGDLKPPSTRGHMPSTTGHGHTICPTVYTIPYPGTPIPRVLNRGCGIVSQLVRPTPAPLTTRRPPILPATCKMNGNSQQNCALGF